MTEKPTWQNIERDRDEPVKLPLDSEQALRGLLAVDPEDAPANPLSPENGSKKTANRHRD